MRDSVNYCPDEIRWIRLISVSKSGQSVRQISIHGIRSSDPQRLNAAVRLLGKHPRC